MTKWGLKNLHRRCPAIFTALLSALYSFCHAQIAEAKGWGLGVGYQNPVTSDLGVSLMYLWESAAFEAALGAIGLWGNDEGAGLSFGGDVDLKVLFGSKVKAYLQGGLGFGAGASTEGAALGLGISEAFAGAGVFLQGSRLYGQTGADYLINAKRVQLTGTLGFFL